MEAGGWRHPTKGRRGAQNRIQDLSPPSLRTWKSLPPAISSPEVAERGRPACPFLSPESHPGGWGGGGLAVRNEFSHFRSLYLAMYFWPSHFSPSVLASVKWGRRPCHTVRGQDALRGEGGGKVMYLAAGNQIPPRSPTICPKGASGSCTEPASLGTKHGSPYAGIRQHRAAIETVEGLVSRPGRAKWRRPRVGPLPRTHPVHTHVRLSSRRSARTQPALSAWAPAGRSPLPICGPERGACHVQEGRAWSRRGPGVRRAAAPTQPRARLCGRHVPARVRSPGRWRGGGERRAGVGEEEPGARCGPAPREGGASGASFTAPDPWSTESWPKSKAKGEQGGANGLSRVPRSAACTQLESELGSAAPAPELGPEPALEL